MPKLWNETIEAHRHEVRDAILDTTAALLAEHGLQSVTISRIAFETGIEPATLASGSRPTRSLPTSTTAPNSRHSCIKVSTSPERSSISAISSETC